MSYVKVENGTPTVYSLGELKRDNPNVSFPKNPSAAILADYGVHILNKDPVPTADIVNEGPIEERSGEWWQTWTSRDLTAAEKRSTMSVTMRQARMALLQQNKLADVATAIAAMPDGQREAAEIEWEYGSTVLRLSPLVVSLGPALGLSEDDLDNLFTIAETL